MDVQIFILLVELSILFKVTDSNENKVRFLYKQSASFKEELVITNVTTDENHELGHGVRKWKTITLGNKSYAIGMDDIGIHLLTTRGKNYTSKYTKITDDAIKVLDVQLHKVWNGTSHNLEPAVLVLLEGGSLSWFRTNEGLELKLLWTLELDKDAFQFNIYTIDKIDYLFALNRGDAENSGTSLDVYKASVGSNRYKYLWPEQTIKLEAPTTSFTLNNQGSDYYLSITQQSLHHVKIYKKVDRSFKLHWKILNTDADTVQSFSIGPKTYLLTNGENSGIYKITSHGLIRETLNETHIINWLPIPLTTYRDEMFLLAQKEIHHHSHVSHSMDMIHSTGFDFEVYHEVPCVYYNDHYHGFDCLAEEDDHHVELNMSAVIPFDNAVGLIISKKDLNSQLFVLNVEVNEIPNPKETRMKRLQGIKDKLERMQKEIHDLKSVKEKTSLLKTSSHQADRMMKTKENQQRNSMLESLDDLKRKYVSIKATTGKLRKLVEELKENNVLKIKKLTINGDVKVEGVANISNVETIKLNGESTSDALDDIVQSNHPKNIGGKKTFANLETENVIFDTLNGIDKNQLIFNDKQSPIILKGDVVFSKGLEVTGNITTASRKVNNIRLEDELVHPQKIHDTLLVDSITVTNNLMVKNINSAPVTENFSFGYSTETKNDYFGNRTFESLDLVNLKADNINSEDLSEILQSVVMKNFNYSIPGTLEIDVLNTSNAKINFLNSLKYPEEYIFKDTEDHIDITGNKKFVAKTTVNSLTIEGLINGCNISDIFTLSGNQNITGTFNFKNLEVIDLFEEKAPTHKVLKPNDIVNILGVDGNVVVEENIGDIKVNSYLDNIIWKTTGDPNVINSTKIFKNISTDNIVVNTINNITKNPFINNLEHQTLNIDVLDGNVTIENLYIEGKIGDVDVKDLLENSVKISTDQNISSFLTFSDLEVDNLIILETLNNLSPNEFLHTEGDKDLSLEKLKDINAKNVIVEGEVFGNIDGLDVDDFKKRVLRKNWNQEIFGDIRVENLYVDHLSIERINGYSTSELFDVGHYMSLMERMILENQVEFKNFTILGNLTLGSINNISMKNFVDSLTFTKENHIQANVTFRDNVNFNGVKIKNFNGVPFKDILENLVFKNETKVKINSTKIFLRGIKVKNYIETKSLNGILLNNILRKENTQKISGPILINGNVIIEGDLDIHMLNDVPLENLEKLVSISGDNIHVNGEVLFNQSAHIKNLIVGGYFNGSNLSQVFQNAIGLNDDMITNGNFIFTNKVHFKEDLDISGTFNDINLSETYEDIAFINKNDYVEGLVSFKQFVDVNGTLIIEGHLLTNTIMGIDPREWLHKGVFINEGLIPGNLKFENITVLNSVSTQFLNNMNTSRFIPLHMNQIIKEDLIVENMKYSQHVHVSCLVNGVEIFSEYLNTVLNEGVQNITSKIKFNGNVIVYEDILMKGKVNNIDFNKVVYTNDKQNLYGHYEFISKCTVNNLEVHGLVNGINFIDWYKNVLKTNFYDIQNVTEPLEIKNLIMKNYSYGPGLISGLNLNNATDDMAYKLQYKGKIENELIADYKAACEDVNKLLYVSKKQISKFKYMEFRYSIYFEKYINLVYYFENSGDHYLLVNEKHSCDTHVLVWDLQSFVEIGNFTTGVLEQIIAIKSEDDRIYLIGRSSNCSMEKINLWAIQGKAIKHLQSLEDIILLQESLMPNTFYALIQNEVRQCKITSNSNVHIYRKWSIDTNSNTAFIPRGLRTGPALRDGQKIIKLELSDDEDLDFDFDFQETFLGEKVVEKNKIMPGRSGEMVVLNVGKQGKTMVAISSREGSSVKTKSDSIKIFSDVYQGTLFHKIPTYKPSSMTALEFRDGETLLLFFEDQKVLQMYAYKGIEGFQHVKSAKIQGQTIIKMKLTLDYYRSQEMLMILNGNELSFLEIVMDGSDGTYVEEMYCEL